MNLATATEPTGKEGLQKTVLTVHRLSKAFPGVQALDNVDFDVREGEVHALVGENGAGKSTLIKIIGGVFRPDSGTIFLNGQETQMRSTHDAMLKGISVIYQEFNLLPELTVAENVFVGREPRLKGTGLINWRKMFQNTRYIQPVGPDKVSYA